MDDGSKKFRSLYTVYKITPINNRLKILLKYEQLKSLNVDTQLVMDVEYRISDIEKVFSFWLIVFLEIRNLLKKTLTN